MTPLDSWAEATCNVALPSTVAFVPRMTRGTSSFFVVIGMPGFTHASSYPIFTPAFLKIFVIRIGKHNPFEGITDSNTWAKINIPTSIFRPLTFARWNTALSHITLDTWDAGIILQQTNFSNGPYFATKALAWKLTY